MVFAQNVVTHAGNERCIGHRHCVNGESLSIHMYRCIWVRCDFLIPATLEAKPRAYIDILAINHDPYDGTARSSGSRMGLNFNFFSVGKPIQYMCVKLLWHGVLRWDCIVSLR